MNKPLDYVNEIVKLRPKVDELKSAWVKFPNNKRYLLPLTSAGKKFIPHFGDDGSITLEVDEANPELTPLVDAVLAITSSVKKDDVAVGVSASGTLSLTPTVYSDLMALVRALLLINYDYTNDDLRALLTCDPTQFATLFGAILKHISLR